ncbi:MAG: carboxypeptidase regulatory-like domain-containing protein, partial [bacterium]|nr:carboxypeptidase regulatory-like domain-containing protein [bacterium]
MRHIGFSTFLVALCIGGCSDKPSEPSDPGSETFMISGTVLDATNGAPVSGAAISLDDPIKVAGTTDTAGLYSVTGSVVEGRNQEVTVHCRAGGFFTGSTSVLTTPSDRALDSVDFALQPDLQDYLIYFGDGAVRNMYNV